MAVAAVTPENPKNIRLGEIGTVRGQNDAVVFRFEGRDYVLRYYEWKQPMQNGQIRYVGSIYGHLLDKEALQERRLTKDRTVQPDRRLARPEKSARPGSRSDR